jgi:hypothetical protein
VFISNYGTDSLRLQLLEAHGGATSQIMKIAIVVTSLSNFSHLINFDTVKVKRLHTLYKKFYQAKTHNVQDSLLRFGRGGGRSLLLRC